MRKEFEINGCIEVQPEITEDEFWSIFIDFVESKGQSFGGGISEIHDGYYILSNGQKGKSVLDENPDLQRIAELFSIVNAKMSGCRRR